MKVERDTVGGSDAAPDSSFPIFVFDFALKQCPYLLQRGERHKPEHNEQNRNDDVWISHELPVLSEWGYFNNQIETVVSPRLLLPRDSQTDPRLAGRLRRRPNCAPLPPSRPLGLNLKHRSPHGSAACSRSAVEVAGGIDD